MTDEVIVVSGLGIYYEDYKEQIQYKYLELTGEVEEYLPNCFDRVIQELNIKGLTSNSTNLCDSEQGAVLIDWTPRNYGSKMSKEKEDMVIELFKLIGIDLKIEDLMYIDSGYISER